MVRGEMEIPSKIKALALPSKLQHFLRHKSNFRLSNQGLLFRVWISEDASFVPLLVVGEDGLDRLLDELHNFRPSSGRQQLPHVGVNKTFNHLRKQIYAFNLRKRVSSFIGACAVCKQNNDINRTAKETSGEQIVTEPNMKWIIDHGGPFGGWASTAAGNSRYLFVCVDSNSRYCHCIVVNSTNDDETFRAVMECRKLNGGFPQVISCDGAIFRSNSNTKKFLMDYGVAILHGRPTVSRDQAKAEKMVGILSRLICKLHTEVPSATFGRIVDEAVITLNSAPCAALPDGMSPKDIHFVRAPKNFMAIQPNTIESTQKSITDTVKTARAAARESLIYDVKNYAKRQSLMSPTAYAKRLKVGDYVLRKRSSFAVNSPKKLAHKINLNAYRVKARIATNSYRVKSVIDGAEYSLPGDLLVRVRGHDDASLRRLVADMEALAERNATRSEPARTRAQTRAERAAAEQRLSAVTLLRGDKRMSQSTSFGPEGCGETIDISSLFVSNHGD